MINIVYDVDDVLNNLNDYVCDKCGVDYNSIVQFNILKNEGITKDDANRLLESYSDPFTFTQLRFRDAAYHICDIEKEYKGVRVSIHSNNFKREIADIKTKALLKEIPGLSLDKISMEVGTHSSKSADKDADFIVEDNIENLLKYEDRVFRILIDKPWNKAETYGLNDKDYNIFRVKSLEEANDIIRKIIAENNLAEKA